MVRDIGNRYQGLPRRSPDMLFQVVQKFYRGAVSHYDLIQVKKEEARVALLTMRKTGESLPLKGALYTLFCEFHFYVTCWLQIELALFRLMREEETKELASVMEKFRSQIARHLRVRELIDQTEECVAAQFAHYGTDMACVENDAYLFADLLFTVDQESLEALHQLYRAIMAKRI